MRYLFGDSAPFPLDFNFLATLESFVTNAARAVGAEASARAVEELASEGASGRARAVESLERFHEVVMHALAESSLRSPDALSIEYVRELTVHGERIVEEARQSIHRVNDRTLLDAHGEIAKRRVEVRSHLEAFFCACDLPILDWRVSVIAEPTRAPRLACTFTYPHGIAVSFALVVDGTKWVQPRRVSEFMTGVTLLAGVRRSWFKKTLSPELVEVDEYVISGLDLGSEDAQIRLRKRLEQTHDSLVFTLKRVDTELLGHVVHPEDPELDGALSSGVDVNDRAQLERLWQLLRSELSPLCERKVRVREIRLDGEEIFASGKVMDLVERLVDLFAPTVADVSRRSPRPRELSLKAETDAGRREELYLRKEGLLLAIGALSPRERRLFAPLGLQGDTERGRVFPEDVDTQPSLAKPAAP
jgi:hypothetical protein